MLTLYWFQDCIWGLFRVVLAKEACSLPNKMVSFIPCNVYLLIDYYLICPVFRAPSRMLAIRAPDGTGPRAAAAVRQAGAGGGAVLCEG